MRAWVLCEPRPISQSPLALVKRPVPIPARGEVLVRVRAGGVCRTDLHLAEGELAPRRSGWFPFYLVEQLVQRLCDLGHCAGSAFRSWV
jgi:propanol-preferring alcohol dehydrogenase